MPRRDGVQVIYSPFTPGAGYGHRTQLNRVLRAYGKPTVPTRRGPGKRTLLTLQRQLPSKYWPRSWRNKGY